jgi:hypothetical protein
MTAPANLALRAFYILAGIALLIYSLMEVSGRTSYFGPAIFGVLLILQGISGG